MTLIKVLTFDPSDNKSNGFRVEILSNGISRVTSRCSLPGCVNGAQWIMQTPSFLAHIDEPESYPSGKLVASVREWLDRADDRRFWHQVSNGQLNKV